MEHPNENDDSAVEDILPTGTIVTNSPTSSAEILRISETDDTNVAIDTGNSQGNNNAAFEPPWEVSSRSSNNNYPTCATRASGQVCICELCEAARLRLLHRRNRSDATETQAHTTAAIFIPTNKRSRDDDYDDADTDDIHDNDDSITKIPRTLQSGSINANSNTNHNNISSIVTSSSHQDPDQLKLQVMSNACRTILQCIGEDPDREGLQKTPERWAKALLFLCHGYNISPNEVTNNAIFCENHNEMVVVRNIDIHSLCEHHMVPFTGHVHIGYIPNGKIIGLSKLARLADLFARRLQVQERLTRQIADSIVETITPLGVAVVMECTHYCMVMRGVQKTGTITTTSSVRGCFETNSKTRAEFFSILHGGK